MQKKGEKGGGLRSRMLQFPMMLYRFVRILVAARPEASKARRLDRPYAEAKEIMQRGVMRFNEYVRDNGSRAFVLKRARQTFARIISWFVV